ncbi:MaoC family dehydratase [Rhodococcus chondri]|uniref:MaoC family dehydratase n=1 Tax=Rhodococcus chondri TaxID=3065941 RepID=A0ABU7JY04_9NOCA|nr:MaoC family dehydratase [Rhodococcus sp. CC-R104]MEE2034895.1 MaoC family dehydratase [Rhodococcus sp. CC-R104]
MRPTVGEQIPGRVIDAVDPARMRTLSALMRDPNPIHFDRSAASTLGLGDRTVNQGPSNIAYVVSMLGSWAGGADRVTGYRFRFLGNVFEGDRLQASGTVTAVEETAGGLVVRCELALDVVDGARVLEGTGTVHLPADH